MIFRLGLVAIGLLPFGCGQTARAASVYSVTLDTMGLIGHPAGPFYFYAVLTDGDGIGDGNNSVAFSGFDLGGGAVASVAIEFGGASGALDSSISLIDSSPMSFVAQQFNPGNYLSFQLSVSSADDSGFVPDRLTLFLLDSYAQAVPTLAPAGDYILAIDLASAGARIESWATDPSRSPTVGVGVALSAPLVTAPEPATFGLGALGLVAAAVIRPKRTRYSG